VDIHENYVIGVDISWKNGSELTIAKRIGSRFVEVRTFQDEEADIAYKKLDSVLTDILKDEVHT
jgi:hypothetical protein